LYRLDGAGTFEEWENAAYELDELLALRATWYVTHSKIPTLIVKSKMNYRCRREYSASKHYDWRLIEDRLEMIIEARQSDDTQHLLNLLRSGLVRNFGNITSPKLYSKAFAGTKLLIEDYIAQVAGAIGELAEMPAIIPTIHSPGANKASETPTEGHAGPSGSSSGVAANVGALRNAWSIQSRLDFVYDTRQAFGRSTLLLQGGSIFGLCHLGVVKALFLRGLLPRIITGTATGALIASLVAIHTDEELPAVLKGDGIDLSAFSAKAAELKDSPKGNQPLWSRWETLLRRVQRFRNEGYFLDVKVLEECVRANVGDLTFEEAYNRSKRVLNITVATAEQGGLPTLLNYLTTPHVVSALWFCTFLMGFCWLTYANLNAAHLDCSSGIECILNILVRR
jgi:TAG lipase / lysophosphatidylethanolamine acyltransferase